MASGEDSFDPVNDALVGVGGLLFSRLMERLNEAIFDLVATVFDRATDVAG